MIAVHIDVYAAGTIADGDPAAIALVCAFGLVVLGAIVYLARKTRRERQRSRGLPAFAMQYGLDFQERAPFSLSDGQFALLSGAVEEPVAYNALCGQWRGLPVQEADCVYSEFSDNTSGGSSRVDTDLSVVLVDLPVTLPGLVIRRANVLSRALQHADVVNQTLERIGLKYSTQFESKDLNQVFRVTGESDEFTRALVDEDMSRWLLSTGGRFAFEISRGQLLVQSKRLPVAQLEGIFDAAKGFVDHIPQRVLEEYGTGE